MITKSKVFGNCNNFFLKLSQLIQPGKTDPHNLEPLGQSHLVELSVVAPLGQEQIGEDMKNFAEQLKPYPLITVLLYVV